MKLVAVSSSNLQAVGWQDGTLRILFNSGSAYDYSQVPEETYNQLMAASSKNAFFTAHVKDVFKYAKVNPNLREEGQYGKESTAASSRSTR